MGVKDGVGATMMMRFKFDIGDHVKMKELEWQGRVISIWFARRGVEYEIRYVFNGEYKQAYFYEDDLDEGKIPS